MLGVMRKGEDFGLDSGRVRGWDGVDLWVEKGRVGEWLRENVV